MSLFNIDHFILFKWNSPLFVLFFIYTAGREPIYHIVYLFYLCLEEDIQINCFGLKGMPLFYFRSRIVISLRCGCSPPSSSIPFNLISSKLLFYFYAPSHFRYGLNPPCYKDKNYLAGKIYENAISLRGPKNVSGGTGWNANLRQIRKV